MSSLPLEEAAAAAAGAAAAPGGWLLRLAVVLLPALLALALLLLYSPSLLLSPPRATATAVSDATAFTAWSGAWGLAYHALSSFPFLFPISDRALWAQGIVGAVHAAMAALTAAGMLLLVAAGEGQQWVQRQQQLSSCGYYTLSLGLALLPTQEQLRQRRHLHVSRGWQALLLLLHLALLLVRQPPAQQRLFAALLGLAELPNGLVLLRDLLALSGSHGHGHGHGRSPNHQQHPQHQHPHPHPQSHRQQHTGIAGTRLAAAIWVSIWAAFFICQLFPLAYLLGLALASRTLLLPSSSSTTTTTAAVATGVVVVVASSLGLVKRMKALSERFQLDYGGHVHHHH